MMQKDKLILVDGRLGTKDPLVAAAMKRLGDRVFQLLLQARGVVGATIGTHGVHSLEDAFMEEFLKKVDYELGLTADSPYTEDIHKCST